MTTEPLSEEQLDALLNANREWLGEALGMSAPDNWQAILAATERARRAAESRLSVYEEALKRARDELLAAKTNFLAIGTPNTHTECVAEVNRLSNVAGDVWRVIEAALTDEAQTT